MYTKKKKKKERREEKRSQAYSMQGERMNKFFLPSVRKYSFLSSLSSHCNKSCDERQAQPSVTRSGDKTQFYSVCERGMQHSSAHFLFFSPFFWFYSVHL